MNKALKKRIVNALVWPVALYGPQYGCETWVMKKEAMDRLEAFEMWVWRRLEKVSWEDKTSNEEVLELLLKAGELNRTSRER